MRYSDKHVWMTPHVYKLQTFFIGYFSVAGPWALQIIQESERTIHIVEYACHG